MLLNKPAGSAEQDYHTHEYADGRVSFSNIGPSKHRWVRRWRGLGSSRVSCRRKGCWGTTFPRPGSWPRPPSPWTTRVSVRLRPQCILDRKCSSPDALLAGYIRIFFYATGFERDDGNLKIGTDTHPVDPSNFSLQPSFGTESTAPLQCVARTFSATRRSASSATRRSTKAGSRARCIRRAGSR